MKRKACSYYCTPEQDDAAARDRPCDHEDASHYDIDANLDVVGCTECTFEVDEEQSQQKC